MYQGIRYKEHRLAWFMHYGEWPNGQIDHINGIKDDNRIDNLRVVSQKLNLLNKKKAHKNNKTGFLGVSKGRNKYNARIKVDSKLRHLGSFSSPEEAHKVYCEFKEEFIAKNL